MSFRQIINKSSITGRSKIRILHLVRQRQANGRPTAADNGTVRKSTGSPIATIGGKKSTSYHHVPNVYSRHIRLLIISSNSISISICLCLCICIIVSVMIRMIILFGSVFV